METPWQLSLPNSNLSKFCTYPSVLYQDDTNRQSFLRTLDEARPKTGWRAHADVVTRDSYHTKVAPDLVYRRQNAADRVDLRH